MNKTSFTSKPRRLTLHNSVWGAGVLVIVVMAIFQVYDVFRRLDIVLQSGERELGTVVRLLAEQTAGSMQAVDAVLRETRTAADLQVPTEDPRLQKHLRERIAQLPQIRELALIRLAGSGVRQTSTSGALGQQIPPEVAAELGKVQDSGAEELRVTHAFFLPGVGTWTMAMMRRLDSDHGVGLVVAYLDLEYFRRFYGGLELPQGSRTSLLGRDGQLLVEHPSSGASSHAGFAARPVYLGLLAASQGVTKLISDPADGSERLYAAQAVPGFPLAVGISTGKSDLLEPWYVQATHSAARTTSLCVSVALLMWLVLRQLRRREQAEARLRIQTASLDELIESAPEAIAMLDLEGRIARVNREFTRLFGYTVEEARGQTLESLIIPEELQQESQRMAQAVRNGQHVSTETQRQRSDGSRLFVSALAAPIVAGTGPIASYRIYRDITERVHAQGERAKLEGRLREAEKFEALGTMAGGIAHDFNSILSAIQGYGNLALDATQNESAGRRYLTNILSAAERGRGLVEQILTYSRSTHGKRALVSVSAIAQDTLELVRAALPANVALHLRVTGGESTIMADPTHVHQLVMNLCNNAVHSMRKGGTLDVEIERFDNRAELAVSHGALARRQYVVVRVRDTGHGIRPDLLDRIFEPFFTTGLGAGGTGLGLALVYAITTDLGGAIDVRSYESEGSTFTLYLPATDAPALETAAEDGELPRGQGQHVLVVEDEQDLMLMHEEMLAALNYEPAGFSRPTAALAEFSSDPSRFDAVVLDQLMPDLTGVELAKRMRAMREAVPIILVTGHRGPLLDQEARAAGIDRILAKPLDFRELAQALAAVLDNVRGKAAAT